MKRLISIKFLEAAFAVCLFLSAQVGYAKGQTVVDVTAFGVKANSFENASPAIKEAIESCRDKSDIILKLPGGRIDLWPDGSEKRELYISNSTEDDKALKVKNIGFWFERMDNLTLDGNNTLVVLHGKMVSFGALNCNNLRIKNISFDYERPTISELTIKSVSENSIETEIHPDSKFLIENGQIVFYGEGWKSWSHHTILYRPGKDIMQYSSFKPFLESKAVQEAPFHIRFQGDFSKTSFLPGDVLTIRDPYRDNCGAFIHRCHSVSVENVNMYFMHGLGIVSQFSENIVLRKVVVAPRKDSGRIISSFADCFHFSGCKGLVSLDSCLTSGSHDDPMNVHGTHLKVIRISTENKLIVRFMHHQTYGFEAFFAGDSIAFVKPETLEPLAVAKVKTAQLINLREMELELDGTFPKGVEVGNVIENLTWTPEVHINNCRFERTNTRGLLITTRRKILIENNTFYHTGMHAILIANDASSWFESGRVLDVTIRNNVFDGCQSIAIAPENHQLVQDFFVHHNIRIENNTFRINEFPVLNARSVDSLIFAGNNFVGSGKLPKGNNLAAFNPTACRKVWISKNTFPADWNPAVSTNGMTNKEIKSDFKVTFNK